MSKSREEIIKDLSTQNLWSRMWYLKKNKITIRFCHSNEFEGFLTIKRPFAIPSIDKYSSSICEHLRHRGTVDIILDEFTTIEFMDIGTALFENSIYYRDIMMLGVNAPRAHKNSLIIDWYTSQDRLPKISKPSHHKNIWPRFDLFVDFAKTKTKTQNMEVFKSKKS